ncbi:MAG: amidohydrolase family protein [Chthonomonas sp.]|nr:amidohydrolase family protein [Chthonomonas sp.]
MILRPEWVWIDGRCERGLEVRIEDGVVREVSATSRPARPFFLSPKFVNAHSHLEYRGFQGKVHGDYFPWIRALTELKATQNNEEVAADALVASLENVTAGVGHIVEHSDRPVASALVAARLSATLFQEVITLLEYRDPVAKLAGVSAKADAQSDVLGQRVYLTPHAPYTVDAVTLRKFGSREDPISIHVAETDAENVWTRSGDGPIGELYTRLGIDWPPPGTSVVRWLGELGLARPGAQFVHCCAVNEDDLDLMANAGVSVAHCPRSNANLGCPAAPVQAMIDRGIPVGLGLDSAASSGPVNMLAELRAVSRDISPEQRWAMATTTGARSVGLQNWNIAVGGSCPLMAIGLPEGRDLANLLDLGTVETILSLQEVAEA